MSNIYIQEPPSNGKVLLKTTVGDIDVELWSKEAPLACRNFVQLCLEGYYDNTIFHRVVKGFIAQGGDPTGTGTGGDSIYNGPFKDEIHSRLRFNRRGLVAMANAGKNDNASQFFFTLGATPELQKKHTIFGKVGGKTIYNMIKLEEGEIDHDERPLYPNKILSTEVISNPFPDIEPRISTAKKSEERLSKKKARQGVKDFKLLSFGEEAEDDEGEIHEINQKYQTKKKHNPLLQEDGATEDTVEKNSDDSDLESEDFVHSEKNLDDKDRSAADKVREKLNPNKRTSVQLVLIEAESSKKKKLDSALKVSVVGEPSKVESNKLLDDYLKEKNKYAQIKKSMLEKEESRERQTLDMLLKFREKIIELRQRSNVDETLVDRKNREADHNWLVHRLRCEETTVLAKDANKKDDDWFEITDPRNAINKRRRENSKINMAKVKEDLK